MHIQISGAGYEILGYTDYQEVFEETALDEYKGEAESLLFQALDTPPEIGENIEIMLDGEKTQNQQPVRFVFLCQEPEAKISQKQLAYCWVDH